MSRSTRRGLPAAGVAAPADRRFRRPELLPQRHRRLERTIWSVGRWVLVLAALGLAGTWGAQRVAASDLFLVREITVRGNARLTATEVASLLGGLRDENVFLVDFEHYRQRAMASPWIERVHLSRILPATIVVDVIERAPLVVARLNQQLYLVDQTGKIIDEYGPSYRDLDLPIVDGLLEAGDDVPVAGADQVQLTAALFAGLEARPDLRRRLSQIDVSNARDAVVMFDDDPAWLHLGDAHFAARLQRYIDLRPALQDRFDALEYVDLKFDERVYVREHDRRGRSIVAR